MKHNPKHSAESELHRLSERMLQAGTKAGKKAGDVAQQAMREWASIWHRVLGEYGYFPTERNGKPSARKSRSGPTTFGSPKDAHPEPAKKIGIRPNAN